MTLRALVIRMLALAVGLGGATVAAAAAPAQALVPVSLSGSVVDATTDLGIAGAGIFAATGDAQPVETTTAAGGGYLIDLEPGQYAVYASADGYDQGFLQFEVTAASTTIPTIALDPLTDGIEVSVRNDTFDAPAGNVTVSMRPVGGGAATQETTDSAGRALFAGVDPGSYELRTVAGGGIVPGAPVQLVYAGGPDLVDLTVTADLRCEPAAVQPSLTNMGFEDALTGWTQGFHAESVQSVTADAFTSPWEGTRMARLGESQPDSAGTQPVGPNLLCQDFTVTDPVESFAFNVFTYDQAGFDQFRFDLVVSDAASGETLAAYEQGAWGQGDALKSSGWRGVSLDLSGHVGETVRLTFRAGGTADDSNAFWAYLDSADVLPGTLVTAPSAFRTATGSVMTDPTTGEVVVAVPVGHPSDLTLTQPVACEDPGLTPDAVVLDLAGLEAAGTATSPGVYVLTVPAADLTDGNLTLRVRCPGETSKEFPLGEVALFDPTGVVTDGVTGDPVAGAQVTLFEVPTWLPQQGSGPHAAETCMTNETRPVGAGWLQQAPTDLGERYAASGSGIRPRVNPFLTGATGSYGWELAKGCWYVEVQATGYRTLVSPLVGVGTSVTDLDLELLPRALASTGAPGVTGRVKVGATLTATPGPWNVGGASYAFQWLRGGAPIPGATSAGYRLTADDVLRPVSVRVTASKDGHTDGTATSDAVTAPRMKASVALRVPRSAPAGSAVRASVLVTVADGPATGKVTVKAGAKAVGSGRLEAGRATLRLKRLAGFRAGSYRLRAVYAGSATTAKATSRKVTLRLTR